MLLPPRGGGVLHRGNGAEPTTLDPHFVSGDWENNIIGDLFMGLITEAADGTIIPGLAESWKISADGKTYTFKLRHAKWSDGKKITAHDFVYSLRRILDPKTAAKYAFILYPIKNAEKINRAEIKPAKLAVKAINDTTLEINLENTTPYFLEQLTHYTSYAIPAHVVKKYAKNWTKKENIVVSGAFTLADWKPQALLKVGKNPQFFDADNVKLDAVVYYPIEDANSELKRYRAGELHTTHEVPSGQFKRLKKDFNNTFRVALRLGIYYYPINTEKITDIGVRKALSLAINRDIITQKILGEGQVAAYTFVPLGINNYVAPSQQPFLPFKDRPYTRNLAEAKKLMKKAGYSKTNPLKIQLKYNTHEAHKKIAVAIAAMWKPIGVQTELFNQEAKIHYNHLNNANFEVGRAGWIGDYNDPTTFTDLFLDNPFNYARFINKKLIANARKAATTINLNRRAEILKTVEKIALKSYSNIPIYYYVSKHIVSDKVRGWQDNIMDIHRSRWLSLK